MARRGRTPRNHRSITRRARPELSARLSTRVNHARGPAERAAVDGKSSQLVSGRTDDAVDHVVREVFQVLPGAIGSHDQPIEGFDASVPQLLGHHARGLVYAGV